MASTSSRTVMLLTLACVGFGLACALPATDCSKTRTMPPTEPAREASSRGLPSECTGSLTLPLQFDLTQDVIYQLLSLQVIANVTFSIYGNNTEIKPSVHIYPGGQDRTTLSEITDNLRELAIAKSHYFLRCFIEPVGVAMLNETNREINEHLQSYWKEFHAMFKNVTLATDGIYKLVKESGESTDDRVNSCDIPRLDDACTFGSPVPQAGYSDRELILLGITNELIQFCNDLLPHLRQHRDRLHSLQG